MLASIEALWQRGRSAWPDVEVTEGELAGHLDRLLGDAATDELVARLCAEDLYLACACARGDARAAVGFEARYGPEIERTVARIDRRAAHAAELRQAVMVRLLVADAPGGRPRIAAYSGRGSLLAWVRIAASRCALNARRDDRLAPADEPERLAERAAGDALDPELAYLRARYQPAFTAALAEALAALSRDQRHLLRLHYLDGLTMDALAAMFSASRAGIHRRVAAARDALFDGTCDRLRAGLGVDTGELASVIRLVRSELDLRLSQLLVSQD